jgi:hypothetical protein
MKKILSLFAVFALVIVMGAGCEEKKPVDISEPVVTLNADELVRLGARTQDTGFQKKDVSGVLTTQLDDAVADVDLQGADLSDVGSASFTSTTITNLTFTTSTQTTGLQLGGSTEEVKTISYNFTASTTAVQAVYLYDFSSRMPNNSTAIISLRFYARSQANDDQDTRTWGVCTRTYSKNSSGTIANEGGYPCYTYRYNDGVVGGGVLGYSTIGATGVFSGIPTKNYFIHGDVSAIITPN